MSMMRNLVCGGLAVAAAIGVAAQPPSPKAGAPVPKASATPDAVRAADPLGAMISEGRSAYSRIRDYTCVFTRQERRNGLLSPEQVAEMKVRSQPASVHVRFAKPEAVSGLELCYVATRPDNKLRFRPAGAKGQNGFLTLAATDPTVQANFRRPASELGIGPILELLAGIASREKNLNNPVEVFTSDFQFAGRNTTRYEVYTRRPHALRFAFRTVVFVDKETKLPIRLEAYDTPAPGALYGELIESHSYSEIRFNVGLGDSAFNH